MGTLLDRDMHHILGRVPKDVVALLRADPRLFMAGGIIRAIIAGETPADIDLFGASKELLLSTAASFCQSRNDKKELTRTHKSDNAVTVLTNGRLPVQFITRWVFETAEPLVASFDFTICQAVIGFDPLQKRFYSLCSDQFYPDLAARRLTYTAPKRDEEVGGSMLRVIKYTKRGYTIQVKSLGAVVARLCSGIRKDERPWVDEDRKQMSEEERDGIIIGGLLREVDPLLVIDGMELGEDEQHRETAP